MSAATTQSVVDDGLQSEPLSTTLLELVRAISEITSNDREVVATVQHMLETGRVRLTGNFRGVAPDVFR